jgi:deferrochelatase/peroxidase EfeB
MCPVAGGGARSALEEWVAAKIIGRWRDGTPLVRWPTLPPSMLDRAKPPPLPGAPPPPASPSPLNEFLFGKEDPDGLRCPFGAHIRRANPRDSLDPGSHTQLEISNRHRILRVGRPTERAGTEREGMLFMCLNADIERQFEFLQQTWLLGPNFHGLDQESDAVLGPGGPDQSLSVPDTNGMIRLGPLARFVETVGGGYFFLPGRDCLDLLVSKSASSQSGSDSRVDLPEENVVPN